MYVADARPLLAHAHANGYALPAFNCCSAEMVRACVEAASEADAPVLIQTYPTDLAQLPPAPMAALVRSLAEAAPVPVALHLDHGPDVETALRCLRAGYGSVMLDGGGRDLEGLLGDVERLAAIAHAQGAALEVAAERFDAGATVATRPEDAARLRAAGADMVAVSVGSEHGRTSRLDLELLGRIRDRTPGPLVLHGGSGIPAPDLAAAAALGVAKVNVGSALYRALRGVWAAQEGVPSHRAVYARAREALGRVAAERIRATGAAGRAADVPRR